MDEDLTQRIDGDEETEETLNGEEASQSPEATQPSANASSPTNQNIADFADPTHSFEANPGQHTEDLYREADGAQPSREVDVSRTANQRDEDSTCVELVFCVCCLLFMILVGFGIYTNRSTAPQSQNFSLDPEYPECDRKRFYQHIEPIISTETSHSIMMQREEWFLTHNGYEMSLDPRIVSNVVEHIRNEQKELVLIYGAIERHKGTLRLFESIQRRLESEDKGISYTMWFYDLTDLQYDSNGTVHERINCLLTRSDEWSREHPQHRLLVVLDHITHYFQKREGVEDRGVIWNKLNHLNRWKLNTKWTLFVVEDPTQMVISHQDYAHEIISQTDRAEAICIPFTGGHFFEQIMLTLTLMNPDIITMDYGKGTKDGEWKRLRHKMRAFSMEDTFHLYYDKVRVKALDLEKKQTPIVLKFEEIERLVIGHNTLFQDSTLQGIEKFAKSFNQSIYHLNDSHFDDGSNQFKKEKKQMKAPKKAIKEHMKEASTMRKQTDLRIKKKIEQENKDKPMLKRNVIAVLVLVAVTLLAIITVWSCLLYFRARNRAEIS